MSRSIETQLKALLQQAAAEDADLDEVIQAFQQLMSSKLSFSVVDDDRERRTGAAEVVFAEHKSVEQLLELAHHFNSIGQRVLMTRVDLAQSTALQEHFSEGEYSEVSRLFWLGARYPFEGRSEVEICVVCAGTSDIPVAEEAALVSEWYGFKVTRVWDVGVSGLHRLMARLEEIRRARIIIVVAGMEGALASVVTGLVPAPVIAVPTSIGYGTNLGGLTTLMAMLTSCASGLTVVNIDNGFGAAAAAARIAWSNE